MALTFSWEQLVNRIRRHINNDFPNASFSTSVNEVLLHINEAMSFGLVGQVWNGAKVMGVMDVPEAYIVQFELPTLVQDNISGKWITSLPQPPLSLPLGYSVNRVYPANPTDFEGNDVIFLKAKRVGRRKLMPLQFGVYGEFKNTSVALWASDGSSLLGQTFYAEMPSTRAVNITDPMNLPDDAQKLIFDMVIARLKERLGLPQDIVQDDISQGNKSS